MSFELIVDIFFRVLNFALFGGLVFFVLKKYGVPMLGQAQAAHIKSAQDAQATTEHLEHQVAYEHAALEEYKKEHAILLRKQQQWQYSYLMEYKAVVFKHQQNTHAIEVRRAQQQEYRVNKQIINETLPEAIKKARRELEQKFANPQNAQRYIHDIIAYIEEVR